MKSKLKSLAAKSLVALALALGFAGSAWADTEIEYLVPVYKGTDNNPTNGIAGWVTNSVSSFTTVASSASAASWGTAGTTNWYVVQGSDVKINGGAVCKGHVNLILCKGAKLVVTDVTDKAAGIGTDSNGSFTIYGQPDGAGELEVTGGNYGAGIGGGYTENGTHITINGGTVTTTGGDCGAGIGGGYGYSGNGGCGKDITINGGVVIATGDYGAGIGGAYSYDTTSSGENITINGGVVIATGDYGAGIGGGYDSSACPGKNITINGGTVTANGGEYSAGIGGGGYDGSDCDSSGKNISINGGLVTANGGEQGAGIGGGYYGEGSGIMINGGLVTANGGSCGAGIGGGVDASGSDITINGGMASATGGYGGAGIGGGYGGNGTNIVINGGSVTAAGDVGNDCDAPAIGAGYCGSSGSIYVAGDLNLMADNTTPPKTAIAHDITVDLSKVPEFAGKSYVRAFITAPILAQPTAVLNATVKVYTNGVLSAETATPGAWYAWSNETAAVVYEAADGYAFAGDVLVVTNVLDTTKDPAVNLGTAPEAEKAHVHDGIVFATKIGDFLALTNLCANGGTGYLTADISVTDTNAICVASDKTVRLCLNDHAVVRAYTSEAEDGLFEVGKNAVFAVYECQDTPHYFTTEASTGCWIPTNEVTALVVKGGYLCGGSSWGVKLYYPKYGEGEAGVYLSRLEWHGGALVGCMRGGVEASYAQIDITGGEFAGIAGWIYVPGGSPRESCSVFECMKSDFRMSNAVMRANTGESNCGINLYQSKGSIIDVEIRDNVSEGNASLITASNSDVVLGGALLITNNVAKQGYVIASYFGGSLVIRDQVRIMGNGVEGVAASGGIYWDAKVSFAVSNDVQIIGNYGGDLCSVADDTMSTVDLSGLSAAARVGVASIYDGYPLAILPQTANDDPQLFCASVPEALRPCVSASVAEQYLEWTSVTQLLIHARLRAQPSAGNAYTYDLDKTYYTGAPDEGSVAYRWYPATGSTEVITDETPGRPTSWDMSGMMTLNEVASFDTGTQTWKGTVDMSSFQILVLGFNASEGAEITFAAKFADDPLPEDSFIMDSEGNGTSLEVVGTEGDMTLYKAHAPASPEQFIIIYDSGEVAISNFCVTTWTVDYDNPLAGQTAAQFDLAKQGSVLGAACAASFLSEDGVTTNFTMKSLVAALPKPGDILQQPATTNDFTFVVSTNGFDGAVTYQWYRKGTPDESLAGETSAQLSSGAQVVGEFYYCVATFTPKSGAAFTVTSEAAEKLHYHDGILFATKISTETELATLCANGGSGYLAADIKLTGDKKIYADVTLCLNGHQIDLDGKYAFTTLGPAFNLHNCDKVTPHYFTESTDEGMYGVWIPGADPAAAKHVVLGGVIAGGGRNGSNSLQFYYVATQHIDNVTFAGNGKVIESKWCDSTKLTRCAFLGNVAVSRLLEFGYTNDVVIADCLFAGNVTQEYGLLTGTWSAERFRLENVVITNNFATLSVGGMEIACKGSAPVLSGKILICDNYLFGAGFTNAANTLIYNTMPVELEDLDPTSRIGVKLVDETRAPVAGMFALSNDTDYVSCFFADDIAWYLQNVEGALEINSRVLAQPTPANGYLFDLFTSDYAGTVAYQWCSFADASRLIKDEDIAEKAYGDFSDLANGKIGSDPVEGLGSAVGFGPFTSGDVLSFKVQNGVAVETIQGYAELSYNSDTETYTYVVGTVGYFLVANGTTAFTLTDVTVVKENLVPVPGQTQSNLNWRAVPAGDYKCVASFVATDGVTTNGTLMSDAVGTVSPIIEQPSSLNDFKFLIDTNGFDGTVTYQWYRRERAMRPIEQSDIDDISIGTFEGDGSFKSGNDSMERLYFTLKADVFEPDYKVLFKTTDSTVEYYNQAGLTGEEENQYYYVVDNGFYFSAYKMNDSTPFTLTDFKVPCWKPVQIDGENAAQLSLDKQVMGETYYCVATFAPMSGEAFTLQSEAALKCHAHDGILFKTAIATEEELRSFCMKSGSGYLTANVTITGEDCPSCVYAKTNSLCLNGFSLTRSDDTPATNRLCQVGQKGFFALHDCDSTTPHYFAVDPAEGRWIPTNEVTACVTYGGYASGGAHFGIFVPQNARLELHGVTLVGCSGHAVRAYKSKPVLIDGCDIVGNTTYGDGGRVMRGADFAVLDFDNADASVTNSTLRYNRVFEKSTVWATAADTANPNCVELVDSILSDNEDDFAGSAIRTETAKIVLSGRTVVSNNTSLKMGSVFLQGGELVIRDEVRIVDNGGPHAGSVFVMGKLTLEGTPYVSGSAYGDIGVLFGNGMPLTDLDLSGLASGAFVRFAAFSVNMANVDVVPTMADSPVLLTTKVSDSMLPLLDVTYPEQYLAYEGDGASKGLWLHARTIAHPTLANGFTYELDKKCYTGAGEDGSVAYQWYPADQQTAEVTDQAPGRPTSTQGVTEFGTYDSATHTWSGTIPDDGRYMYPLVGMNAQKGTKVTFALKTGGSVDVVALMGCDGTTDYSMGGEEEGEWTKYTLTAPTSAGCFVLVTTGSQPLDFAVSNLVSTTVTVDEAHPLAGQTAASFDLEKQGYLTGALCAASFLAPDGVTTNFTLRSDVAMLPAPGEIIEQPSNTNGFTFVVSTNGFDGAVTYQWYRKGTPDEALEGETSAQLSSGAQVVGEFYYCVATFTPTFGSAFTVTSEAAEKLHYHDGIVFATKISTEAELVTLCANGGSGYLAADIKLTGDKTIGADVALCLNGHQIDLDGKYTIVSSGPAFNLHNCDKVTPHYFTESTAEETAGRWMAVADEGDAKHVVYGGVITGGKNGTSAINLVNVATQLIDNVTFAGNGSGFTSSYSDTVRLSRCAFFGNVDDSKLMNIAATNDIVIADCLFTGNITRECGLLTGTFMAKRVRFENVVVTNNIATAVVGGFLLENPASVLSGKILIRDNYLVGAGVTNDANTVILSTMPVELEDLDPTSRIGVRLVDETGAPVAGMFALTNDTDYAACFFADDPTWYVKNVEGALELSTRVLAQPTPANGYLFDLCTEGYAGTVAYQWYSFDVNSRFLTTEDIVSTQFGDTSALDESHTIASGTDPDNNQAVTLALAAAIAPGSEITFQVDPASVSVVAIDLFGTLDYDSSTGTYTFHCVDTGDGTCAFAVVNENTSFTLTNVTLSVGSLTPVPGQTQPALSRVGAEVGSAYKCVANFLATDGVTTNGTLTSAAVTLEPITDVTVAFDAQDGAWADGATVSNIVTAVDGGYVLPAESPTRAKYDFAGWYVSWTNGAASVTEGAALAETVAHTIYAKWISQSIDPGAGTDVIAGKDIDGGKATIVTGAATNEQGEVSAPIANGELALPDRIGNDVDTSKFVAALAAEAYAKPNYDDKVADDKKLTSVYLPSYMTRVGDAAFYACTNLTNVVFAAAKDYTTNRKTALELGSRAFANTALETITFPVGTKTRLAAGAFANCPNLKEIFIYGEVECVAKGPFAGAGNGKSPITVHLSPTYAADKDFVAMLTASMNTSKVVVDTEPLGTVTITAGPIVLTGVTPQQVSFEFQADITSPWGAVNADTVTMFYSNDPGELKNFVGTGKWKPANEVKTSSEPNAYSATFDLPDDVGTGVQCYRLTVGAERP